MGVAKRKRRVHDDDAHASTSGRRARAGGAGGAPARRKVNGTLRYEFPSNFDTGCAVQAEILREVERHGFNHNSLFATRLALEEALVNAIKHGNQLDSKKTVIVEARVTRDRVEIQIEDQGPGFDRSCVPDPTAEENLCKCSGRGILLIEAYMNKVSWSRGGRRVRMVRLNEESELPEK
jgi:serine/threonine-protein kinase RsbW